MAVGIASVGIMSSASHSGSFRLASSSDDCIAVVILGTRGSIASLPLHPALCPILVFAKYPALENDSVELLAHLASLCLPLNLIAINNPPAIRERAGRIAISDRARGLLRLAYETISKSQRRVSRRPFRHAGMRRTPVPSGASRQFGESGTKPSQYGQRIVRAQR